MHCRNLMERTMGAMKDKARICLAKLSNSSAAAVAVLVLKATSHQEAVLDQKHVDQICCSISVSRSSSAACARALVDRISHTRNYNVALKVLILVHNLLQVAVSSFEDEFLLLSHRFLLCMSNFRDNICSNSQDLTDFLISYALYIDERLDSFQYSSAGTADRVYGRFRFLEYDLYERFETLHDQIDRFEALEQKIGQFKGGRLPEELAIHARNMAGILLQNMPFMLHLLERVLACRPGRGARQNYLVKSALVQILTESFQFYLYTARGMQILLRRFQALNRHDKTKVFNIYKKFASQASHIESFYELCKDLSLCNPSRYPVVVHVSDDELQKLYHQMQQSMDKISWAGSTHSNFRSCLFRDSDFFSSPGSRINEGLPWEAALMEEAARLSAASQKAFELGFDVEGKRRLSGLT